MSGYVSGIADRLTLSARTVRVVDLAVAVWTLAWVVVAVVVASEVRGLKQLSVTVVAAGAAAEEAGNAVAQLDDIPVLGDDAGRVGDRAREAGDSAQQSGAASRESVENAGLLLGIVVGFVPTLPLLAAWIPFRVRRHRDVQAVRRALAAHGEEREFREFLARRALERLPYALLLSGADVPWDLTEEDTRRLARAELERLGLTQAGGP